MQDRSPVPSNRLVGLPALAVTVVLAACGSTMQLAQKPGTAAARLECASLAHGAMASANETDAMAAASMATRCTEGFLMRASRTHRVWNVGRQRVGRSSLKVVLRDASPHLQGPFRIVPAASVSMAMYRGQRNLRPGFGVPVVLLAPRCADAPVCALLPPSGVFRWATAWMDIDPEDGVPRLVLAHPVRSNPAHIGGRSWELAVDSSAFYAAGLQDSPIKRLSLWGVFGGRELGRRAGVYLLEDYDPGKRPLVMIHGLGSSPLAWARLSNAVWADPELRRRYQVWQLVYQTNDPILIARLRVQEHLDAAWAILDPEGDDPARGNMVLVGHSMGGVVSRLMISEARDQLWDAAFVVPESGLAGDRADIAALDRLFRFTPYPGIRRAVLVAAPHGGSPTADGFLGRMANALVGRRAPEIEALRRVAAANEQAVREELRSAYLQGKISSITTLRSTQPVMRAAQALPTAPDVPYHTIAGHLAGTDPPGDGVVPLDSAVLPGSTSVLVVPSGHNVHEHDEAIGEVLRILYQPHSGGW